MKSILKLAVFVAIIYGLITYAKPHLESLTGTLGINDLPGTSTEVANCISTARRTTQSFSEVVSKRARPPINISRWSGSYRLAEGRLENAKLDCQCPGEACDLGQQALGMLGAHMSNWDQAVHDGTSVLNGARRLREIYETLDRAERAAVQ